VGAVAKLTGDVVGDSGFQIKAFSVMVALVGLSVLLFSDRVRLLSRRFISRHFERPLHDYRAVWRTFSERTARCVDEAGLCTAIVNLVSEVFQALSVGMWVVEDGRRKLKLAASTSIPSAKAKGKWIEAEEAAEILRGLGGKEEPIDIDASQEKWAATLRRAYPSEFPRGGSRLCVPVKSGKEVAGCMVVADRVGGIKYSLQDLELLKAIGDQLAASLVNLQLSERLAQAKQLEAFQAMSAFFVHDLKNAASRLALMLKNFPVHYEKAEFREDAFRGIGKTVRHLNDLIGRLNMLRHELQVHAVECDLNNLLRTVVLSYEAATIAKGPSAEGGKGLVSGSGDAVEIVKDLGAIPTVRLDPGQMEKVITNLVLNARDAVGGRGGGRIQLRTGRRNGWVVVGVADNGCGMTAEFIRDSLFRPFRTTKKEGMGIGMFHCKMIVEAHRGQIEVESEVGKGTEFRVLLPTD
jgi:putative PEP-CTERM system histidine kinase